LAKDLTNPTDPSTAAHSPTASSSLDGTNEKQTNERAELAKPLSVESDIATNVRVEAGNSNKMLHEKPTVVNSNTPL
nr:hypothetical protein [Tanacetum cinerariifolium]